MEKFSDILTINKSATGPPKEPHKLQFNIQKSEDDKMQAFGWAYVCVKEDGVRVVDHSGDMTDIAVIEAAAYGFVRFWRDGSDNHERGGCAELIESMVFTKEKMQQIGITEGTVQEGWWIGFQITDMDVWDKVKDGTYRMFSIEGIGERVPIEGEEATID